MKPLFQSIFITVMLILLVGCGGGKPVGKIDATSGKAGVPDTYRGLDFSVSNFSATIIDLVDSFAGSQILNNRRNAAGNRFKSLIAAE